MRAKFPVTIHLLLLRKRQILLLRRSQTGYMDGWYSLPAGHLDGEETVRMAGVREAWEEIGVRIDPGKLVFDSVLHRHEDDERVDFFFHISEWDGEPMNMEPEKCDDLRWVDLNELPTNTVPYVRKAIRNYLDRVSYDEFGWGQEGSLPISSTDCK